MARCDSPPPSDKSVFALWHHSNVVTRGDLPALGPVRGWGVDFLISYAEADEAWAEWIAWQLEAAGYKVYLQAWDLQAGSNFVRGVMERMSAKATRTLAVLSAAYLASAFAEAQWRTAWAADPSSGSQRLVPVRVEDCPRPGVLGQLVGLDLFGVDQGEARRRLLSAVAAGRRKPDRPPDFPGAVEDDRRPPRFPGPLRVSGVWAPGRSPFPGLASFDRTRASVFLGRKQKIIELVNGLTNAAGESVGLTVVVGPSGCGKSSLVAAGLAPQLAQDSDWLVLEPMQPGSEPNAAFAAVLAEAGRTHHLDWDTGTLTGRLAEPEMVALLVQELLAAAAPARRLLLVVDQAEELLVRPIPAKRTRFLELLATACTGPVRVVATLRSEYLDRLVEGTDLAGLRVRVEVVEPLARDLLPLVIAQPAQMAGLTIDEELVAQMVTDTGDGQALPLLAYTLRRLHDLARDMGTTVLSHALYNNIGGVRGALLAYADDALATAVTTTAGRVDQDILATLLSLVTLDTDGRPVRRRIPLNQVPDRARAELVPFVKDRLLIIDATPGGSATVEIAHERLLTAWQPLAQTIMDSSRKLRQRDQAEAAAEEWERHGHPARLLWNLGQTTAVLTAVGLSELTGTAERFLRVSHRHGWGRRAGALITVAILLLLAIGLGVTALQQSATADDRRHLATVDKLLALADSSRDTDPVGALRLGIAAARSAGDGQQVQARGNLLDTLSDVTSLHTTVTVGPRRLSAVAVSESGVLAAASNDSDGKGAVHLWDLADPDRPRALGAPLPGSGRVSSMAFGPGGLLAIGGSDDKVQLWETSNPTGLPQTSGSLRHSGSISAVAFDDHRLLAVGSNDAAGRGEVQLWDAGNPAQPSPLGNPLQHPGTVTSVAFGPDGLLAVGSAISDHDGRVQLWNLDRLNQPRPLGDPLPHTGQVWSVAFGLLGRLAVGGDDGRVQLWDLGKLDQPQPSGDPLLHDGVADAIAFSPGGLLAVGTGNGTVRLWDAYAEAPGGAPTKPREVGKPLHQDSWIRQVAFGPDGLLVIGGSDGEVQLWDTGNPTGLLQPSGSLQRGGSISAVAFGDNGILAVGGNDGAGHGEVQLWDTRNPAQLSPLGDPLHHTSPIRSMTISSSGLLAVGGSNGQVQLWKLDDPEQPRPVGNPLRHADEISSMAFDRDTGGVSRAQPRGELLAVGGADGVYLWDLANPDEPRREGGLGSQVSGVRSVVFGAGGLLAVGDNDGTVGLWNVSNATRPRKLGAPLQQTGRPSEISLWNVPGPTGSDVPEEFLAVGSSNGIQLWDVSEPNRPRKLGDLLRYTSWVNTVAFSSNGLLAVGADDGTMRLWDVRILQRLAKRAVDTACERAGRGLDKSEWDVYLADETYRNTCPDLPVS